NTGEATFVVGEEVVTRQIAVDERRRYIRAIKRLEHSDAVLQPGARLGPDEGHRLLNAREGDLSPRVALLDAMSASVSSGRRVERREEAPDSREVVRSCASSQRESLRRR